MSEKPDKKLRDLIDVLDEVLSMTNKNWRGEVDVSRIDAAELVLKHYPDRAELRDKAIAVLLKIAHNAVEPPVGPGPRVRAVKVLLDAGEK
jgi:hypothetical protein